MITTWNDSFHYYTNLVIYCCTFRHSNFVCFRIFFRCCCYCAVLLLLCCSFEQLRQMLCCRYLLLTGPIFLLCVCRFPFCPELLELIAIRFGPAGAIFALGLVSCCFFFEFEIIMASRYTTELKLNEKEICVWY